MNSPRKGALLSASLQLPWLVTEGIQMSRHQLTQIYVLEFTPLIGRVRLSLLSWSICSLAFPLLHYSASTHIYEWIIMPSLECIIDVDGGVRGKRNVISSKLKKANDKKQTNPSSASSGTFLHIKTESFAKGRWLAWLNELAEGGKLKICSGSSRREMINSSIPGWTNSRQNEQRVSPIP